MTMRTREEAARARAQAVAQRSFRPSERRSTADPRLALRSPNLLTAAATPPMAAEMTVERKATKGPAAPDGTALTLLGGHATTYEQPYEMYDFFGPYTEIVTAGAGESSLNRADLNTVFVVNHRSLPMAKTTTGTLDLAESDYGLRSGAYVDERLTLEADVVARVERKLLDEMSFAFMIVRGSWSPDWMEYRIYEYDIHRGDTSVVTFGANPTTDIGIGESTADRSARLSPEQRAAARRVIAAPLVRS